MDDRGINYKERLLKLEGKLIELHNEYSFMANEELKIVNDVGSDMNHRIEQEAIVSYGIYKQFVLKIRYLIKQLNNDKSK